MYCTPAQLADAKLTRDLAQLTTPDRSPVIADDLFEATLRGEEGRGRVREEQPSDERRQRRETHRRVQVSECEGKSEASCSRLQLAWSRQKKALSATDAAAARNPNLSAE